MSEKIEDGGPAVTRASIPNPGLWADEYKMFAGGGMSLRDWFAGQALALMKWNVEGQYTVLETQDYMDRLATASYQIADAMLKARGQ